MGRCQPSHRLGASARAARLCPNWERYFLCGRREAAGRSGQRMAIRVWRFAIVSRVGLVGVLIVVLAMCIGKFVAANASHVDAHLLREGKRNVAVAAQCLKNSGWVIGKRTAHRIVATRYYRRTDYRMVWLPPRRPIVTWTSYESMTQDERQLISSRCERRFDRVG